MDDRAQGWGRQKPHTGNRSQPHSVVAAAAMPQGPLGTVAVLGAERWGAAVQAAVHGDHTVRTETMSMA